jgi:hypothetical protein
MGRGIRAWFSTRMKPKMGRPYAHDVGERPHISLLEELRAHQKNRCAICESADPRGKGDFHLDHDHRTGKIRGLLCSQCNRTLGHSESPERLRRAADYLERGGVDGIASLPISRFVYPIDMWSRSSED